MSANICPSCVIMSSAIDSVEFQLEIAKDKFKHDAIMAIMALQPADYSNLPVNEFLAMSGFIRGLITATNEIGKL